MATYPAREAEFSRAVESIVDQVDRLVIVLNEYREVPAFLDGFGNVEAVLIETDLKDTGKFWPAVDADDDVFLVDDDIVYANGYVQRTLDTARSLGLSRAAYGYHGSFFRVGFRKKGYVRRTFAFRRALQKSIFVDQLGTGTVYLKGVLMPPFEYMRTAQRFVDIRFALWCFEQNIEKVCLARRRGLLSEMTPDESIWQNFTQSLPEDVFAEAKRYGRRHPRLGQPVHAEPLDSESVS